MDRRAEIFLEMAGQYKRKYEACAWWKFKKKHSLYKDWQNALDLVIKHDIK